MTRMENIQDFLAQKRFAFIGVSRQPKDFSRALFREFQSRGYEPVPVHLEVPEIEGARCFTHLRDIQPPVESVLLMTSPAVTNLLVRECAETGIKRVWFYRGADGKTVLWLRPMNLPEAHAIPGTEGAIFPFWSPDSHSVGFFSDGKLKTIDIDGGSAQVVADVPLSRGGAWGADGTILFSASPISPMMRVNAPGGTPVAIPKIDLARHTSHRWPFFLPDGKHFVYLAIHHDPSQSANNELYYASLDGRENRPLFRSQSNAIYSGGYLLFARGDQ